MISVEEALQIAKNDLLKRDEDYIKLCEASEVRLQTNVALRGKRNEGKEDDIYTIWYTIPWGLDYVSIFMDISAHTGEIYARIGPGSYRDDD